MSNWEIIQALAFEPRKAFAGLRLRPRFWMPLLVVALATGALSAWYTLVVDIEWLTDLQLRNNPLARGLTEAQIEQQVAVAGQTVGTQATIGGLGYVLFVAIGHVLGTLYFLLAGKITNLQYSFRQWFALSCWAGLPALLSLVAGALVLLGATGSQIDPAEIRPLSLNMLHFNRAMGEAGYTLLTSIELPMFLTLYLAIVGVKEWSGRSWLFSTVFAALPTVLVFGTWAYFSLGRS